MPRFDGTGPQGQGPMTGRGMGPCGQGGRPVGPGMGRGAGRGMGQGYGRQGGRGYGRGFCWYNPWRWFGQDRPEDQDEQK